MKHIAIIILFFVFFLASVFDVCGQQSKDLNDPNYGSDSISRLNCATNLSIMSQFVKINSIEYAYPAWNYCFMNCPAASKNIYLHGVKILKYYIENAADEAVKDAYIDTLMMLYDQRMEHFKQEGYVLGKKGVDLYTYRKKDVARAYEYLNKSVEIEQEKIDESVALAYITATYALMQDSTLLPDSMISNYMKVIACLEKKPDSVQMELNIAETIKDIDKIFALSGAANCESLIEIFTSRYNATPNDIDLLKKITSLLDENNCEESELFAQASESLYKIEPSPQAARNVAAISAMREDYSKAKEFYNLAIEQDSSSARKAEYYYELGIVFLKEGNYPAVRKNATVAIDLKNSFGDAYLLIGNAYAASSISCGSSDFEKAAVYWVAVDKFNKAKTVDSTVTEKANDLINRYSKYFPNNEDAFFNGLTDGQSYKVGCWINENTTVRTSK